MCPGRPNASNVGSAAALDDSAENIFLVSECARVEQKRRHFDQTQPVGARSRALGASLPRYGADIRRPRWRIALLLFSTCSFPKIRIEMAGRFLLFRGGSDNRRWCRNLRRRPCSAEGSTFKSFGTGFPDLGFWGWQQLPASFSGRIPATCNKSDRHFRSVSHAGMVTR